MATLKTKSEDFNTVILTVSDHLKSLSEQSKKHFENKSYALNTVDLIFKNIIEIDSIVKENKAVFYRFVPLKDSLFDDESKKSFRDQHHHLDNLIYVCFFAVEDLKDKINGIFEDSSIDKTISTFKDNIDRIKSLYSTICDVGWRFVDNNKDIFDITDNLKVENKTIKILIVDDEPGVIDFSTKSLERRGYKTYSAKTVAEAIKCIKEIAPNIVLLDLNLDSNMEGIEVLKFIRNNNLPIKVIVISVIDNDHSLNIVKSFNPEKIFIKPIIDLNQLFALINALVGNK